MDTRRKWLMGLAAVVTVVGVGGYLAYDFWRQDQLAQADLVLYGNIDIREAALAFNVPGRVDRMLVEEGDKVANGQLLATLEPGVYQAGVDAATAQVDAQRAVLDRLIAGSRSQEIREAHAKARAIEVALDDARSTLRRTKALAVNGFASQQKVDNDQAAVKALEAQLTAAEQMLSLTIQGPRAEDIAVARAQLRGFEAQLTLSRQQFFYTELHAVESGVVNTRIVEPGTVVLSHSPVYAIALSDPVWARTYVSEPDLGRIYSGMAAEIETDAVAGKTYVGWIGFISPVAEFTPKSVETVEVRTSLVYRLRVYVENPDNGLRQGMPVTIKLIPGSEHAPAGRSATQ